MFCNVKINGEWIFDTFGQHANIIRNHTFLPNPKNVKLRTYYANNTKIMRHPSDHKLSHFCHTKLTCVSQLLETNLILM